MLQFQILFRPNHKWVLTTRETMFRNARNATYVHFQSKASPKLPCTRKPARPRTPLHTPQLSTVVSSRQTHRSTHSLSRTLTQIHVHTRAQPNIRACAHFPHACKTTDLFCLRRPASVGADAAEPAAAQLQRRGVHPADLALRVLPHPLASRP